MHAHIVQHQRRVKKSQGILAQTYCGKRRVWAEWVPDPYRHHPSGARLVKLVHTPYSRVYRPQLRPPEPFVLPDQAAGLDICPECRVARRAAIVRDNIKTGGHNAGH